METSGYARAFFPFDAICIFIVGYFMLTTLETGAKSIRSCPARVSVNEDLRNLEDCPLIDQSKMLFNVTECVRERGMSDLCLSFGTGRGLAPKGLIACFARYQRIINICRNDTSSFKGQLVDVKTMMKCRFRPSLIKVTVPTKFSFFF